jgi:hypothetical protein
MYARIAIQTVTCVACAWVGWALHDYKTQTAQIELSKNALKLLEKANGETLLWQSRANSAQKTASIRETRLSADRNVLHNLNGRLRDELSAARSVLPNSTCGSVSEYAATLAIVYGECRTVLSEMGFNAQSHAIDSKKLIDAWPTRNGAADTPAASLDTVAPNQ